MDHEVGLGGCNSDDWLLNSTWDHFSLHLGKNGRGIMEVEVPKYNFQGLINALTWSNGFCVERGKRGGLVGRQGPMAKKCHYNSFFDETLLGWVYIQLFPLGKAHKAHFSTSIWCKESWEASPPSTCLDHIIAHKTYHFFHALPLKLAPTCFINQCGISRTQEFGCIILFLVYQLKCLEFGGL